jgi:hypothetical protein
MTVEEKSAILLEFQNRLLIGQFFVRNLFTTHNNKTQRQPWDAITVNLLPNPGLQMSVVTKPTVVDRT